MLILEVGIWLLPFTLLVAPMRRMVHLVRELRRIVLAAVAADRRRSRPPTSGEVWSRLGSSSSSSSAAAATADMASSS
ncbi:hypothetical protein GUJ93_ZPchr0012g21065 [Zizania palustris]|uniref:Uncharacterized protein n=1 Tax=Zizania palustris TaxID=103762 RepID=A0A8J5WSB2_ZIZPA|nr:hypothetical protein GUJ93_ZPchr0012g21065 [Zizania palustris]